MKNFEITNPDKILYPKFKIKKIDVVKYYYDISKKMMPYVQNRLLAVIRCYDSVDGECFFKKHPTTEKKYVKIKKDKDEEYFYIISTEQLVFQAQMGTIEFHTWGSYANKINSPNVMVFDLDPDEKLSLSKLTDAVKKIKSVLDELELESFLKTSGGKGYHIVVPFQKHKNWKNFYDFSRQIALYAENKWPNIFTTNIRKTERKGKIFIDYLRNNRGATCVAPYSLRAREGATISMPISWKDLDKIAPNEVNILNYKKYLNNSWKNFKF